MQCNNWLINVTGPFLQPLFRGFLVALGEWPKKNKHETAFFWSRCYGMTKKIKRRQLRVIIRILPISVSLGSVYHACQTVADHPATFESYAQ
jgi:hypothetical protein